MSSVGESSSSGRSAGNAPSHESDSGSDSSSSSSESSLSSPSSSSAASESSSVSSQQAEAARAEESDEPEARSSDAARDAARAGASVSAQQAAAEDAAEDASAQDAPDEAAAAARGRAAVASGDLSTATEAAKAGPAARDAVEKEMVAQGQFQAVNDLANDLDAEGRATAEAAPASGYVNMDQAKSAAGRLTHDLKAFDRIVGMEREARKYVPSDAAKYAHDAKIASRVNQAPDMLPGDFSIDIVDAVADTDIPINDRTTRSLVGMSGPLYIENDQPFYMDGTSALNVYDTHTQDGYVAELVANVQVNRLDQPQPYGPPTTYGAERVKLDLVKTEKAFENFDGLSLGRASDGRPITLDVSINTAAYHEAPSLSVNIRTQDDMANTRSQRAHFEFLKNEINIQRSRYGDALDGGTFGQPDRQNVITHEFGHAGLGLPDEYDKELDTYVNDPPSIMHVGNELKTRHGVVLGDIARGLLAR